MIAYTLYLAHMLIIFQQYYDLGCFLYAPYKKGSVSVFLLYNACFKKQNGRESDGAIVVECLNQMVCWGPRVILFILLSILGMVSYPRNMQTYKNINELVSIRLKI